MKIYNLKKQKTFGILRAKILLTVFLIINTFFSLIQKLFAVRVGIRQLGKITRY
jgi:hypothetical protein